jgi:trehalose 6-phosphate phosphatase
LGSRAIRPAQGQPRLTLDPFFFAEFDARGLALFLDFDGTLVDMAATPGGAWPEPGLAGLLQKLAQNLDGALAIITGRPLSDIDRLLAPAQLCGAGVHGAEIRDEAGGPVREAAPPLSDAFFDSVRRLEEIAPGVLVERKSAAIAVHYRLAETMGPEVERRLRALLSGAGEPLDLRPGKMLVEAVPHTVSKGAALRGFMRRTPFAGRLPVMIGDDRGDLAAFEAAEAMGGKGLRVAGEFFSSGDAHFSGTAAVRQWLEQLSGRISAPQQGGDG